MQQALFEKLKTDLSDALIKDTVSPTIINECDKLLSEAPGKVSALTLRAVAHRLAGDFKACVQDCSLILESDPTNRFALLHRAAAQTCVVPRTKEELNIHARHINAARNYARRSPDDRFATFAQLILMGIDPKTTGRIAGLLRGILEKNPNDLLASVNLLAVYTIRIRVGAASKEDMDDAVHVAKKILTFEPENAQARNILWCVGKDERYKNSWAEVSPEVPRFISYPLLEQDPDLAEHIQKLPYGPV